jgi:hypothetical protein
MEETRIQEIERVVADAVHSLRLDLNVLRVTSRAATYGDDQEVLRLTVVLDRFPAGGAGDWPVLSAIGAIHQSLVDAGDSRFPVIDFITEEELEKC